MLDIMMIVLICVSHDLLFIRYLRQNKHEQDFPLSKCQNKTTPIIQPRLKCTLTSLLSAETKRSCQYTIM